MQDIEGGVEIIVLNNASIDGTNQWLASLRGNIMQIYNNPPLSVAACWNNGLEYAFGAGVESVLVVNNDVELRPDTYRRLVQDGGGFVTAVGTRDPEKIKPNSFIGSNEAIFDIGEPNGYRAPSGQRRPHPDFSCYLIRKSVWEKVGKFDEKFLIAFGEDWDYHVRLHKAGITAECIDLPFLHHGSMTVKNAEPAEAERIQVQAKKNRDYFKEKHGFAGASKEYYDFFGHPAPVDES